MSALKVKNNLHKLVVETDDEDILNQVEAYFLTLVHKIDWWDTLSEDQRRMIEQGRQQLANGEGIPHEEVRDKVDQLLNRI